MCCCQTFSRPMIYSQGVAPGLWGLLSSPEVWLLVTPSFSAPAPLTPPGGTIIPSEAALHDTVRLRPRKITPWCLFCRPEEFTLGSDREPQMATDNWRGWKKTRPGEKHWLRADGDMKAGSRNLWHVHSHCFHLVTTTCAFAIIFSSCWKILSTSSSSFFAPWHVYTFFKQEHKGVCSKSCINMDVSHFVQSSSLLQTIWRGEVINTVNLIKLECWPKKTQMLKNTCFLWRDYTYSNYKSMNNKMKSSVNTSLHRWWFPIRS